MKLNIFSYRFALEILQHPNHGTAWSEIETILTDAPLFIYPGKSAKNAKLLVVQQLMNTYFDRRFAVDYGWEHHPLATGIPSSNLAADFRKSFAGITVQAEIQFGNMARWYSDIFKFQAGYSKSLIQCGLSVVPMASLARQIDSNIVNFERAKRELPSAELSITLPILLIGVEPDDSTSRVDVRACAFSSVSDITGKGKHDNRWRIVNGFLNSADMSSIGPHSPTGPMVADSSGDEDED